MIEARELTKRYGDTTAVHSLSFTIAPGTVTGFLGPNGAGKSTTMRMIMGLDRPTSGTVTVNGKPYRQHRAPLREVGALLEASAVHPGRSARSHLRSMAATHNIKASRVSEVIEMTGLAGVATKRVAGFSLGMGQRLGIAAALLGDPRTLILDEPVNGLDPEGVQWVRQLVRALAAEGRTVFLSSHLMSEMSQTADHLLVIGRGRIIAAGPVQQVIDSVAGGAVRVRSPRAGELAAALAADGATVTSPEAGMLEVSGTTAEHVGEVAFRNGLLLHELSPRRASLEEAYMSLTQDAVEYRAHTTPTTSRTKLLSLRSTWWALASTAAVITLVALAAAASLNAMADDPALAPGIEQMHGAEVISSGFHFGMLTIAVLGALLITGEYATGLIRSTFAAVPTRIPVLAAKALTLVVLTAAVTLVSVTLSYFLTMPRLSQYDLVPALDDPGTWRVFGGTLYSLISAALFSLGVGTLLRSTAASLTAALTVLLLLPGILSFIRLDWVETIVSYLPLPASSALLTTGAVETQGAYLSAQASLIVMAAYAVVPIAAAAVTLHRRDA
jgi:ABC-2 type transport system ATP-binding protein